MKISSYITASKLKRHYPIAALSAIFCLCTPTLAIHAETVQYFIVSMDPNTTARPPPIPLQIPSGFTYGISSAGGSVSGINLLTWLRNFRGIEHGDNRSFGLSCIGYCNGRIFIHLELGHDYTGKYPTGIADFVSHSTLARLFGPHPSNVSVKNVTPAADFNEGYEMTVGSPLIIQTPASAIPTVIRYFFRNSATTKAYDLYAECNVSDPYPACQLIFSLRCYPDLSIRVSVIRYQDISLLEDIRKNVDHLIAGFVSLNECHTI